MITRDAKTKAILNTDVESLNKYKRERNTIKKIEQISNELSEVKLILANVCRKIEEIGTAKNG